MRFIVPPGRDTVIRHLPGGEGAILRYTNASNPLALGSPWSSLVLVVTAVQVSGLSPG
jgi:hypothetical protein